MKKKLLTLGLCLGVTAMLFSGCGKKTEELVDTVSDQEAADEVASLIDAIYVQQRTDSTDEDCAKAKAAWDALTDTQKELVEGENADPDYFGRDTGDASKDDPRNGDDIGENEILVVSFGTSFNDSRVADIKSIEDAIQEANPDWSVRRAFTAQIIINHIQARDNEKIDNMDQALERAVNNGVKNLLIQPTHLMHGAEYDELVEALDAYSDKFESVAVAEPLLGQVGEDASITNADKKAVAEAITARAVELSDFDTLEDVNEAKTAFVFMGHGTSHAAKVTYSQMSTQLADLGYQNVFVGTVEGEPEETSMESVIEAVQENGYENVVLRPLMVVAGDHANNDMAGDEEDSWKSGFEAAGLKVITQIEGLGSIPEVQKIYVQHTEEALSDMDIIVEDDKAVSSDLKDGQYEATFKTDSSMFHVNEVYKNKGTLTVKNGKMIIHVVLSGDGINHLYLGKADAAAKDESNWLNPVKETVTYSDGETEEVNAFDIPVVAVDQDFDVALIGNKGVWYDHVVSVTNVN